MFDQLSDVYKRKMDQLVFIEKNRLFPLRYDLYIIKACDFFLLSTSASYFLLFTSVK